MKPNIKSTVTTLSLIFSIALIKALFFSRIGFGLLDEGESLHNATRILAGQLPYRDFFAIFPPLDNYIFAVIFDLFGKSVLIPRVVMSSIFAFAPCLLYLTLIQYVKKPYALLAPCLLIFLDLNIDRLYFFTPIFLAVYLVSRSKYLFLAGLLLGITSLIRADIPGTYLIGLGLVILLGGIAEKEEYITIVKKIVSYVLGYSLPVGSILYWLHIKGIFGLFVKAASEDAVNITKLHSLPFPAITNIVPHNFGLTALAASYEALFAYLVLFSYLIFGLYAFKNFKGLLKTANLFLGMFVTGILALPYIFGRSDMGHIVKGGMPFLFFGTYLLSKLQSRFLKIGIIGLVGAILIANIFQSIWWLKFNTETIRVANYTLRVNPNYISNSTAVSGKTIKAAVDFLTTTEPSEKVLTLPYMAGLYFLADRQSPTEFNNVLAGFIIGSDAEHSFIAKVEQAKVKRLIYARELGPKMKTFKLYQYNPLIDRYIMENYKIVNEADGWLFMERN